MKPKGNENKQVAQGLAKYRAMVWAVDFFSWKWLAVTTGVMVYSAFYGSVTAYFSPAMAHWVLAGIVLFFYMIIDQGIAETLGRIIKGPVQDAGQDERAFRAHKKLMHMMVLFLIIRLFATGLSSLWAGGEIGDLTTDDFNPTTYTTAAAMRDSTDRSRMGMATTELQQLRATEAQRLAAAEAKGKAEVAAAVRTGNPSQQEMWRRNPGYFSPPPRNQWYPPNKAFADRIHAAQANAERYIAEEKARTQQAEALYYNVTADTTAATYLASLGLAANSERQHLEIREQRRTRLIIIVDVLAVIFGLLARFQLINIDIATNRQTDEKSIAYLLALAMERLRVWGLEMLESMLGLDIDGNGQTGTVTNRMTGQQIGFQLHSNVNQSAGGQAGHPEMESPAPTPRRPIGFFSQPHASDSAESTVATSSYHSPHDEIEAQVYKDAYANAKSKYDSWKNKQVVSEAARQNKEEKMAEHQAAMQYAREQLQAMGYDVRKVKGRFRLIEL